MTVRSEEVRAVLRASDGWMTDKEVCAALDSASERPVRAYDVHARLMTMVYLGIVEAERPPDAPNRYRLSREPNSKGRALPPHAHSHAEYIAAFCEGERTAEEVGRAMGVTRRMAGRHAMRGVAEGALECRRAGRRLVYRKRTEEGWRRRSTNGCMRGGARSAGGPRSCRSTAWTTGRRRPSPGAAAATWRCARTWSTGTARTARWRG